MKSGKRVILMTPSMSKGGAETQLLKVALFLRDNGHKVLIISLKPIDEFNGVLEKSGISLVFLGKWGRNTFSNLSMLWNAVKIFRPDVIVAFMFIAIIFARLLKLRLKFRLISTIRISVIPKKWYLLFKLTSGLDDAVVYNSVASKNNFEVQNFGLKNGLVINNGISINICSNEVREEENLFTWVCVAHFRWNKDYLTLFKAVTLIKERKFRLDIIGELNSEIWPYEIIKEMGISEHVRILGFKPNASYYLERSDAFVLSSFSEGMPNAILEAMAYGRPVVVTDIDGNRELVQQAGCGFLCERQNEYSMAANMLKIMDMHPLERNKLGAKGKMHIEKSFGEEKVMNEWMQLIEQLTS
ncbi:glycosyltransferase [Pedobacter frigoris]|uniref:Glycosyltransferase n=1 Tax=Pedobacter frigoris TaxID=2571272 RepID=A0A4U1CCB3_9SPHI|nr:glycosyltransferase [Pedobacter frigoris]TKC03695.1 glycosyltransferase [Pedobacter frigoris]